MELGLRPADPASRYSAEILYAAEPLCFETCPICLTALGTTREHVPPRNLGGHVMTMTCEACNNRLGSRVEDELKDWFDEAIGSVRFSGGEVSGRRRSPRVLVRWTEDGEFVLLLDAGRKATELRAIFASGEFTMDYRPPSPAIWRIAALKHAYLAACLVLRKIPDTPLARQIRGELIAARDAPSRGEVPPSEIATRLRVASGAPSATGRPSSN